MKVNNHDFLSCLVWFALLLVLLGHSYKPWVAKPMDVDMDVLSCIRTVILVKRERISRPHKSFKNHCIVGLFYNYHHYNSEILSYIDQNFCWYLVIKCHRACIHYPQNYCPGCLRFKCSVVPWLLKLWALLHILIFLKHFLLC